MATWSNFAFETYLSIFQDGAEDFRGLREVVAAEQLSQCAIVCLDVLWLLRSSSKRPLVECGRVVVASQSDRRVMEAS